MKPLAVDLFCGTFAWSAGWLEQGGYVVGFDLEHLPHHGPVPKGADLVIQNVLTLHGSQFREASLILASPPCQKYSYMAMPWSKAKAIAAEYRSGARDVKELNALFDACFRIQREAIEAAGHFIPLVVENVRGAIPWVGRSRWNYGSFHLWGDVPALMPMTKVFKGVPHRTKGHWTNPAENVCDCQNPNPASGVALISMECPIHNWNPLQKPEGVKAPGMNWSDQSKRGQDFTRLAAKHGVKVGNDGFFEAGSDWMIARGGPHSKARKAASAAIAKIPFPLARFIAHTYHPSNDPIEAKDERNYSQRRSAIRPLEGSA